MGLRKGFDATVSIVDGSTTKTVKTIGDIDFSEDKTKIEVVNRASRKKRSRPGMIALNFSFTVQGGTDPEDSSSFDAYNWFWEKYCTEETFSVTFTDAGGHSRTETVWCSQFNIKEPIDDLETAEVTVEIAGHEAGDAQTVAASGWTDTSSSSSSSSSSSNGEGGTP